MVLFNEFFLLAFAFVQYTFLAKSLKMLKGFSSRKLQSPLNLWYKSLKA